MRFDESIVDNDALSDAEQERFEQFKAQLPEVRASILASKESRELPVLSLPQETKLLGPIIELAQNIRNNSAGMIVLGTGGSSLGGKTLCALSGDEFEMHFVENLDPHTMDKLLSHPKLSHMHLLIISKSGGTMETLTQATMLLQKMDAKKVHAITMPGDNALQKLAQSQGISTLEHDPKVGGRFSVLANVGLLPASVAGVDIAAVSRGAAGIIDRLEAQVDGSSLIGSAWQAALMPTRPTSVLMPYCDRMKLFGDWFRQLWAESLSKGGIGSTPAAALGSVDQHSQLQLYLDGPKDKLFTFVTFEYAGQGAQIDNPATGFEYLSGKTIGDAMSALQHGTIETIKRHGLPLRVIKVQKQLDAEAIGALLMHMMIETMAVAKLLRVNAFDQPAVEESKQLARIALGAE